MSERCRSRPGRFGCPSPRMMLVFAPGTTSDRLSAGLSIAKPVSQQRKTLARRALHDLLFLLDDFEPALLGTRRVASCDSRSVSISLVILGPRSTDPGGSKPASDQRPIASRIGVSDGCALRIIHPLGSASALLSKKMTITRRGCAPSPSEPNGDDWRKRYQYRIDQTQCGKMAKHIPASAAIHGALSPERAGDDPHAHQ